MAPFFLVPSSDDGDGKQERRQPHHREGESVHAHRPVDTEGFNQWNRFWIVVEGSKGDVGPINGSVDVGVAHEHRRCQGEHGQ
jgi:hypothetical protein